MLYSEFINKAMDVTIVEAENGSWYLEPTWTVILLENNLDPENISDYATDWPALNNVLSLEVTKRNTINSKKNDVINWLYETITTQVDPMMLEEETDYLKNLTEYLKANKESKLNDEDWNKFTKS